MPFRFDFLFQKKFLAGFLIVLLCSTVLFFREEYQKGLKQVFFEKKGDESLPERILIPKTKTNLPVLPARVINDNWELSKEGVYYLLGSGIPGKEGNAVIYGHDEESLFGPIKNLKKGEKIEVTNKKEEKFVYKVIETKTVTPERTEILFPTKEIILTLYTCAGPLDQERFVIVAKMEN